MSRMNWLPLVVPGFSLPHSDTCGCSDHVIGDPNGDRRQRRKAAREQKNREDRERRRSSK